MKGGEVITALWTSGFNQLQMWGSVGVFFFFYHTAWHVG